MDARKKGNRLSIISKSNIRYEGTLSNINPENNTVSLEHVKLFGTENRPADRYVPAKEAVYDYIVFKGDDIKDLTVYDDNNIKNLQDPAIVSAGMPVDRQPNRHQHHSGKGGGHHHQAPHSGASIYDTFNKAQPSDYNRYSNFTPGFKGGGQFGGYGGKGGGKDHHHHHHHHGKGKKGGGKGGKKGGKRGNSYANHTGMEFADDKKDKPETEAFKDEFDFGASHEKMKEKEQEDEKEKVESKYKKATSFFDELTYDANNKERVEKIDGNAQHRTNCDTFGTAAVEDYERKNHQGNFKGKGKGKGKKGKGKGYKGYKGEKGGKRFY